MFLKAGPQGSFYSMSLALDLQNTMIYLDLMLPYYTQESRQLTRVNPGTIVLNFQTQSNMASKEEPDEVLSKSILDVPDPPVFHDVPLCVSATG